jgi:hypothetical protein
MLGMEPSAKRIGCKKLLPKVLSYIRCHNSDSFDSIHKFPATHSKLFGPVANLMFFMDVDSKAILLAPIV